MRSTLRHAVGGITACTVMMLPGIAAADMKSVEGEDFSIDRLSRTKMETCDQEADSQKVHADVRFSTDPSYTVGKWVVDGDGANSQCASRSFNPMPNGPRLSQHRTVEQRFLGDILGNWVSTT